MKVEEADCLRALRALSVCKQSSDLEAAIFKVGTWHFKLSSSVFSIFQELLLPDSDLLQLHTYSHSCLSLRLCTLPPLTRSLPRLLLLPSDFFLMPVYVVIFRLYFNK